MTTNILWTHLWLKIRQNLRIYPELRAPMLRIIPSLERIKIKISSHHHHRNQSSHALNHLTKPTKDQNQAKLSQLCQPAQFNDQNHQHMMERSKDRPAHCTIIITYNNTWNWLNWDSFACLWNALKKFCHWELTCMYFLCRTSLSPAHVHRISVSMFVDILVGLTNTLSVLDQVYCAWLIKWVVKSEIVQLAELCLTRWWIISDTWWYWVSTWR